MAQKPETVFRQRIRPLLAALPNTAVFPIQQKAIKGDPDFILCINGLFVGLELKSDDGETIPLQDFKLDNIAKARGIALVSDPHNWSAVYEFLKEIACSEPFLPASLEGIKFN